MSPTTNRAPQFSYDLYLLSHSHSTLLSADLAHRYGAHGIEGTPPFIHIDLADDLNSQEMDWQLTTSPRGIRSCLKLHIRKPVLTQEHT